MISQERKEGRRERKERKEGKKERANKCESSLPPSPIMMVTIGTFRPAITVRFVAIA